MADRLLGCLRGVKSLAVVAAVLVAAGPVAGQTADSRNAAAWYQRSFARLGSIQITDDEWKAIREYQRDPHAAPSATVRAVLARAEPALSAARRGARQGHNDFGLDYSQGYELLLPHLSQLRNVGRLMAADAKLRLHDGSASTAADQIASMYRMSDHLGTDATIISSLVGQVIFEAADQMAASGIDRGAFGPAESTALRDALKQLGPDDPFAMIGAIETEKLIMVDWLRERYAEAEDRASLFEDFSMEPGAEEALAGLTLMDQTQFEGALDEADETLGRVIEAFKMDDPNEARFVLEQIVAECQNGEHGPLAMLMPSYSRLYEKLLEARAQVAERDAQLAAIIAGTVAPGELANAAVLYLQVVEMIGQIDPARLEQLLEVASQPLQPIEDEPAETLRSAAGIVETLRRAAQIPRCDFSIVYGRYAPVIPGYLAGLRQAGRLLAADAVRMLQEAEDDQAAERMAICFRMSAHLAGDPIIASTLVSHNVFNGADELTRWALGNDAFSVDDRARLFVGVEAMPRKDPFGYVAAVRAAREQIRKRLRLTGDAQTRAEQTLNRCDGDQLLYLLVVVDEPGDPDESRQDEAAGLAGIISPEGLAAARGRAKQAFKSIEETDDLSAALVRDLPLIGNVRVRQATARADLRRAYFALQVPES
ncbi:MAG: hypothetical protein ACYSW1_05015 [Planctomycetota bacterium]|jgi:hypothetical protein